MKKGDSIESPWSIHELLSDLVALRKFADQREQWQVHRNYD